VLPVLLAGPAAAQVPYVPTPTDVVERMLTLAKVRAGDYIVDLGSGDGRIVRTAAAKFGARGFGVERNEDLVRMSNEAARREGVAERVTFMARDLFETPIGDATVLTMYLLPAVNAKLRPRLLTELRPGTRIVSHDFDLGDWQADEIVKMYSPEKYAGSGGDATLHLWIVPADFAGRWQWSLRIGGQNIEYQLEASQRFQRIEGTARVGGAQVKLENARLSGDRVSFTLVADVKGAPVRQTFSGRIVGDAVEGSVTLAGARLQGAVEWSAARTARGAQTAPAAATAALPANTR